MKALLFTSLFFCVFRVFAAVPVVVEPVESRPLTPTLGLIGHLQAKQSVVVSSVATGRVIDILVENNQSVEKGQPLILLESSKQQALLAQAKATLGDQKRRLNEFVKLQKRNAITQSELETQRAQVAIAQAQYDSALVDVEDRVVKAPFNGQLGLIDFSLGQWINTGSAVATLDDLSSMQLDIAVPERYLSALAIGMPVSAMTQAWPGQRFVGEVVAIDSRVDIETLNVRVRVQFDNPERRLKSGMLMDAEVHFPAVTALSIQPKALQYAGTERYVYRLTDKQTVQKTQVWIGDTIEDRIVVEKGLQVGDQVVVQGTINLRDGVEVMPRVAMPVTSSQSEVIPESTPLTMSN